MNYIVFVNPQVYYYCKNLDAVKKKVKWLAKMETPGHNVCRIFQSAMCVKLDKDGDVSYYKGNNDNADSLY
jgi:hypothetical protein